MTQILAIFIGGGLGSLARYGISRCLGVSENGFPFGTLGANILACIVLGFALGFFAKRMEADEGLKSMIMVGFCGGFSTFSSFSSQTLFLFQGQKMILAFAYMALSIILCLGALLLGNQLSRLT